MVFRWCRSTRAGSWGFEGRWSTLRQRSSNALPPSTGPRRVKPLRPTGPCRVGKGVRPRRRDGRSPSRRPGGPAPQWWQRRPRRPPVTPQTHPRTDGLDRRGSVVGRTPQPRTLPERRFSGGIEGGRQHPSPERECFTSRRRNTKGTNHGRRSRKFNQGCTICHSCRARASVCTVPKCPECRSDRRESERVIMPPFDAVV